MPGMWRGHLWREPMPSADGQHIGRCRVARTPCSHVGVASVRRRVASPPSPALPPLAWIARPSIPHGTRGRAVVCRRQCSTALSFKRRVPPAIERQFSDPATWAWPPGWPQPPEWPLVGPIVSQQSGPELLPTYRRDARGASQVAHPVQSLRLDVREVLQAAFLVQSLRQYVRGVSLAVHPVRSMRLNPPTDPFPKLPLGVRLRPLRHSVPPYRPGRPSV